MTAASDDVLRDAGNALSAQRHARSIGAQSARLKRRDWVKKIGRAALVVGAVLVGTAVAGSILNGIGFWGVLIAAGVIAGGVWAAMRYPRPRAPTPDTLRQSDLGTLAGKTEIWLESQRPLLPAPAVRIVDNIGAKLDALSPQLAKLNETEPAAYEVRKLVGEHLPELVDSYRAIPPAMRGQKTAIGSTPDEQLAKSLGLIEQEIAGVTQQIAQGDIDNLSVRGRYLELKYEGATEN